MNIIVLLSSIHFSHFFPFIYKSKTTMFSIQREIIITSFKKKLTIVSTDNFKIDINGISDPLEMWKNIISAKNPNLSSN